MSQPTHLGHGVPESNASLAPAFVATALVVVALLAAASPLVAAAVAGGLATALLWSLVARTRRNSRRPATSETPSTSLAR